MKKIYVENIDDYILVDDEDFERVNCYKWHANIKNDTVILAYINQKKVTLLHYITGKENTFQIERGRDFRKSNIELEGNRYRYKRPQKNSSSKYKGVSYNTKQKDYKSYITINKGERPLYLGSFKTEREAAQAYNNAVMQYWNGDGYLNDV